MGKQQRARAVRILQGLKRKSFYTDVHTVKSYIKKVRDRFKYYGIVSSVKEIPSDPQGFLAWLEEWELI